MGTHGSDGPTLGLFFVSQNCSLSSEGGVLKYLSTIYGICLFCIYIDIYLFILYM